jgi:tRNA nucleotidyltransferase (CCA-adding enzyme)
MRHGRGLRGVSETHAAGAAGPTGEDVLRALAAQPGGAQLLALARDRDDLALVGGAVRDLLLERAPRELDVVVASGAAELAQELASLLGASTTVHERFGTAAVAWEGGRVDIAERRAESYSAPGTLPAVRAGTVEEDLRRRDFTVNAIAVPLAGAHRGELQGAEHALEDVAAGRLRVLHDGSFVDDPTRLLRLARYRARLDLAVEERTGELAADALAADALATVSRARVGAELRLALGEADALGALRALDDLHILGALHPLMRVDMAVAHAALGLLSRAGGGEGADAGTDGTGGRALRGDLLALAVALQPLALALEQEAEREIWRLLDDLEFPAHDQELVLEAAIGADALSDELASAEVPSEVYEAASQVSLEAVALAGAWGQLRGGRHDAASAAGRWLEQLRKVKLSIGGDDLLEAGIAQGPEIGRRLRAALVRKLDGELEGAGREAELSAALEARV